MVSIFHSHRLGKSEFLQTTAPLVPRAARPLRFTIRGAGRGLLWIAGDPWDLKLKRHLKGRATNEGRFPTQEPLPERCKVWRWPCFPLPATSSKCNASKWIINHQKTIQKCPLVIEGSQISGHPSRLACLYLFAWSFQTPVDHPSQKRWPKTEGFPPLVKSLDLAWKLGALAWTKTASRIFFSQIIATWSEKGIVT